MKTTWLFLLVLTVALVSALPKKRGGGSRRPSSSSSGTSSSSNRNSGSKWGGSSSGGSKWGGGSKITKAASKVKAKNFKTVKKVALVAAGAYVGYKLAKLGTKFAVWSHGGSWGFDDWDDWREADGMLCRTSNDCQWVDRSMQCEDWEIRRTGFSSGWFGGVPTLAIRGECACPEGTFFDDDDMDCKPLRFDSDGLGFIAIIGIIVAVILATCCCVCCCVGKKAVDFLKN